MSEQNHHEEEILGKAYDSRLMKRLLRLLIPYWPAVLVASVVMIAHSLLQVVGPFLTKVAVDRYLVRTDRQPTFLDPYLSGDFATGLTQITVVYLTTLALLFLLEYAQ